MRDKVVIAIWALLIVFFIVCAIAAVTVDGNDDTSAYEPYRPDSGRFDLVEDCGTMHVYTDTETGAEYLVTDGGGVCLMQ